MCTPFIIPALSAVTATAIGGKVIKDVLTPKLPDIPKAEDVDAPPKATDPKVQAARQRERDKARGASGRSSTLLTGSGGLTGSPVTSQKTLLGQ